jgi:YbbR domain-containing protein
LQGLRQKLLRNLGIKITSLILALAVYAHVYARQEQEAVLRVPVVLDKLPEGLAYRGDVAEYVRVRILAKGAELIRLRAQPPQVVISLAQARPGLLQRPVTTGDVVLPDKTDATVVSLEEPVVLSLQIEPLFTARLPVKVVLHGVVAAGTIRHGSVLVWPESLSVTGPAGVLSAIDSVLTQTLDLDGHAETFGASLLLVLPPGVQARPDQVVVRIPIVPAGRQEYGSVAVILSSDLRESWRPDPEKSSIRLTGPKSLLESVRPADLRLRANLLDPPRDGARAQLEAVLPFSIRNQVRVESVDPETAVLRRRGP